MTFWPGFKSPFLHYLFIGDLVVRKAVSLTATHVCKRILYPTSSTNSPVIFPSKRLNLPPTEEFTWAGAQVNARINSGWVRTLYSSTGGHLKFCLQVYDFISTFTPICNCFMSGVLTEDGTLTPGSLTILIGSPLLTSASFFGKIIPWVKSKKRQE